jgi:catechol 2,3-dioxygenase-like lactoylglutathione lyase family enzyme
MKLTNTRLITERFDETYDFYAQGLGLQVTWGQKGDVYVSFRVGGDVELALFEAKLMDEHIGHATEDRKKVHDKMMLVFTVDDLDREYRRLKEQGIPCLNEPHDVTNWGIRCLHLRDPEGNLIELNQELPKEQWSKDLLGDAEKYTPT